MISKKDYILLNFNLLSKSSFIKNYIKELLNKNSVLDVFCANDNNCNYALKNEKNEHAYIYMSGNQAYVYSTFGKCKEEINYYMNENTIDVFKDKYEEEFDNNGNKEIDLYEEEYHYNMKGDLISCQLKWECYAYNIKTCEKLKNIEEVNFVDLRNIYLINNKLVCVNSVEFDDEPDKNFLKYFECDYKKGMLGSGNETEYVYPSFCEITEEEYNEKYKDNIQKKALRKTKNMI